MSNQEGANVRPSLRGWMQGYNGQAVVNEHQMILAAEVETVGADFGDLEPMLNAAQRELAAAGVPDTPEVLLADVGYWHGEQMERIVDRGNPGAHPARHQPFAARRAATATAAITTSCEGCSPPTAAAISTASVSR